MEIKNTMLATNINKSPGLDRYGSGFYNKAWNIVGDDVGVAVQEFFKTGRLLKHINATSISLISKKLIPNSSKYRPIGCCNVLYKCIKSELQD